MFDALKKWKAPAERLAFLETTLAPQIADAERTLQARRQAERAATIRSRADELAAIDAEIARLEKAHSKLGPAPDAAIRTHRALQDEANASYYALRGVNYQRELVVGRYERALAALGNDTIARAHYRVRWMARIAEDHIGTRPAPAVLKRHERPIDFPQLDWVPATLAEVTARALIVIEGLTLAPVSPTEIESTCEAQLAECYQAAGPRLLASAPWARYGDFEAVH